MYRSNCVEGTSVKCRAFYKRVSQKRLVTFIVMSVRYIEGGTMVKRRELFPPPRFSNQCLLTFYSGGGSCNQLEYKGIIEHNKKGKQKSTQKLRLKNACREVRASAPCPLCTCVSEGATVLLYPHASSTRCYCIRTPAAHGQFSFPKVASYFIFIRSFIFTSLL